MDNTQNQGKKAAESSFFKNFTRKAEEYINKPSRLKQLLTDAYQRASEQKDLGTIATEVWESFQQLYRMIRAYVSGEYQGIDKKTLVGGIAVLIYLLSPIDLIPDFIPVIGMLDDAALLAWFLTGIKTELDHFAEWEATQATEVSGAGGKGNQQTGNQGPGSRSATADSSDQRPKYDWGESQASNRAGGASTAGGTSAGGNSPLGGTNSLGGSAAGGNGNTGGGTDEVLLIQDHTVVVDQDEDDASRPSPSGAAPTGAGEPSSRANTTDSTRLPSGQDNNENTSGGNVR